MTLPVQSLPSTAVKPRDAPFLRWREKNMKIIVLGTGCAKCKKLYAEAEKAIASSGQTVELEKSSRLTRS